MNTKAKRKRHDVLQILCRRYLKRLGRVAKKYGLLSELNELIEKNRRKECEGTEEEVRMLARCVDDERIARHDIPQLLNKSYRATLEDGDFDKVKKLRHVGIYSKLSALLLGAEKGNKGK